MSERLRVLVTKIGLDGHDRGSRLVARWLRDAGMEVIYTAPWQSLDAVCSIAVDEDVDVIGISTLATDHLLIPKLMKSLRSVALADVGVVVGGIVPDDEQPMLLEAGVHVVLGPGASGDQVVEAVRGAAEGRVMEGTTR